MPPRAGNRFLVPLLGCLCAACSESSSPANATTSGPTDATATTQITSTSATEQPATTTGEFPTSTVPTATLTGSVETVVPTHPNGSFTQAESATLDPVESLTTTTLTSPSVDADQQSSAAPETTTGALTTVDPTSRAETTSETADTSTSAAHPARVLLYHFSTLDIPTLPQQLSILTDHLAGWGYEVDTADDSAVFSDQNLANYAAVGMINTCFSPFGANQDGTAEAEVLQRFLSAGGGLFGLHCADVTFQSANPPALYNQLLGGRASNSNFEGLSHCSKVASHPTTERLPETFTYTGNLDGTNFIAEDTTVLVNCKWDNGNGQEVAVSWVRTEGLGRVFFSNFAKVDSDLVDATIGEPHLVAGLSWVLGL